MIARLLIEEPHCVTEQPDLSVIVPFYNEEENIRRMHAAIVAAVEPLGVPFEMVLVNDGSRDHTLEIAIDIARGDPRVRVSTSGATTGRPRPWQRVSSRPMARCS